MSEKSDKSSPKKKTDKLGDGKKYAVISPQSVITLAESCGISGLSEDIASKIGEDVAYRLREIIQGCSVHMRNNCERVLKSSDVAKVLPKCSEMQIFGYVSGGSSEFLYVPESGVFVNQGNETYVNLPNLALSDVTYTQKGDLFVSGLWYVADDTSEGAPIIGVASTSSVESSLPNACIAPHLSSYFSIIAKVILCKHGESLHYVLQDLRSNTKITLVVPYFMNLLIEGLQELPRGSDACEHMLRMLHALTLNPSIYRDASIVISGLITALLTYTVHPLPFEMTSLSRDLELRDMAAEGISKVLQHWYGRDESMLKSIVQKMQIILYSPCSSVQSHYGALVVLSYLDNAALFHSLWSHLEDYLAFLEKLPTNLEGVELVGCVMRAAGILYRDSLNVEQNLLSYVVPPGRLAILDRLLYSYFGDALCAQWQFSVSAIPLNKVTQWRKCTDKHFLDLINQETNVGLDSKNTESSAKKDDVGKMVWKGNGTISEMFELRPVVKRQGITFKSIGGVSSWNKQLQQRCLDVDHRQFTGTSSYYIKCSRLKPVGKMSCKHLQSPVNFTSLFSTSL